MATISKFEDLEIWQLARKQVVDIYLIYTSVSFQKDFELINQISKSSGSVMDNIAEGFERSGNREFINFLIIAKGSNGEVRSQLYRALDKQRIDSRTFEELKEKCETLSKKLTSFIKYLRASDRTGFRYS